MTEDINQTTLRNDAIPRPCMLVNGDNLAAILSTSGSTRRIKTVEYTNTQLIASAESKSAFHETQSGTDFLS